MKGPSHVVYPTYRYDFKWAKLYTCFPPYHYRPSCLYVFPKKLINKFLGSVRTPLAFF